MENKSKTITIGEWEYETETTQKGRKFFEIVIPKGWRLWEASDFKRFTAEQWKELNLLDDWFFIKQFSEYWDGKGSVAKFCAGPAGTGLGCTGDYLFSDPAIGARFKRKIGKKGKQ